MVWDFLLVFGLFAELPFQTSSLPPIQIPDATDVTHECVAAELLSLLTDAVEDFTYKHIVAELVPYYLPYPRGNNNTGSRVP